jgi:opine dehydrogenase
MSYEKGLEIAVIGAGHGGKAMAADMAAHGYAVRLYNRTYDNIEAIAIRGGIEITFEDGRQDIGFLRCVTSDIAEAIEGVSLIMVVVPASAHRDVALAAAP